MKAFSYELLHSLRTIAICDDRRAFTNHKYIFQDELYARLIVYRYENKISVLDDLHFEKTIDFIKKTERELLNLYDDLESIEQQKLNCYINDQSLKFAIQRKDLKAQQEITKELNEARAKLNEMTTELFRKYEHLGYL